MNETAHKQPTEDGGINSAAALSIEATAACQAFSQQVLQKGSLTDTGDVAAHGRGAVALSLPMEPNPFFDPTTAEEGHVPASLAYRYRKVMATLFVLSVCELVS